MRRRDGHDPGNAVTQLRPEDEGQLGSLRHPHQSDSPSPGICLGEPFDAVLERLDRDLDQCGRKPWRTEVAQGERAYAVLGQPPGGSLGDSPGGAAEHYGEMLRPTRRLEDDTDDVAGVDLAPSDGGHDAIQVGTGRTPEQFRIVAISPVTGGSMLASIGSRVSTYHLIV